MRIVPTHTYRRGREIERWRAKNSGRDCSLKLRRTNIYRNVHYSFSPPRPTFDISANGFPDCVMKTRENTESGMKRRVEKERTKTSTRSTSLLNLKTYNVRLLKNALPFLLYKFSQIVDVCVNRDMTMLLLWRKLCLLFDTEF